MQQSPLDLAMFLDMQRQPHPLFVLKRWTELACYLLSLELFLYILHYSLALVDYHAAAVCCCLVWATLGAQLMPPLALAECSAR